MIWLYNAIGIVIAVVALCITLWQVFAAKRMAKLAADLSALAAFLVVELAGRKRRAFVEGALKLTQERCDELGSRDVLESLSQLMTLED